MANRRMFSLKVIDTDMFLDMSPTSQLLYFHLAMRADDDGFVSSPKTIMKVVNAAEDDMKILILKKYLIPFESGVCVIRDWKIHNYIQSDRYSETEYKKEKLLLKEVDGKYDLDTECIQDVHRMLPQVRLGKDRLDLVEIRKEQKDEKLVTIAVPDELSVLVGKWNSLNVDPNISKNTTTKKTLLPVCRKITPDINLAWSKLNKLGYKGEDAATAIDNYVREIRGRDPKNDYSRHRFSLCEFLKQENGFRKFINR
jgi:hypothetical protein